MSRSKSSTSPKRDENGTASRNANSTCTPGSTTRSSCRSWSRFRLRRCVVGFRHEPGNRSDRQRSAHVASRTALPSAKRAQLHEIADLVGDPEPVAAELRRSLGRRRPASGSSSRPLSRTSQISVPPSCQMRSVPPPAAVPHAVRRHLVDRQHEVLAARAAEARRARAAGDEPAHARPGPRREAELCDRPARLRQRIARTGPRRRRRRESYGSTGACRPATTAAWLRCASAITLACRAARCRTGRGTRAARRRRTRG